MMGTIFSFLIKIGLGGIVDRTYSYLEKKAELEGDKDRLKTQITIEQIRSAVAENRIHSNLTKSKMEHQIFWWFLALFIVPLGIWWLAVILDSIFQFGADPDNYLI